ncbi:NUDIX hydrolase [Carboxylicivirga sp. N1Y90]|uniref:NUDIX hydrolase n=1 Tax=Carboxylicivirga fragile TaxID=3417571 RepID=UPI003D343F8D|nr:NUDIX domain-containing protein [Marinilabiliaceae bacterium N1Y90]
MYKVFFKDRILFLTDSLKQELTIDFNAIHKYTSHHELNEFITKFESNPYLNKGFIYGSNKDVLLAALKKCFKFITAAGGLVQNNHNELLIIHRLGVFDLPKGKTEKGESFEETALREVEEECGIDGLKIEQAICSTFHTYQQNNIHFMKETVWFKMSHTGSNTLSPQVEEQITEAKWLDRSQINTIFKNTYPSIIEVFKSAGYTH